MTNISHECAAEVELTSDLQQRQSDVLATQLADEQSLAMAILAGSVGAVVGAWLMATLATLTGDFAPVLTTIVALLASAGVRVFGKGIDWKFGVIGAVLTLLGCFLGFVLIECILAASNVGISTLVVVSQLNLNACIGIIVEHHFNFFHLIVYVFSAYTGYKNSLRWLTLDEEWAVGSALPRKSDGMLRSPCSSE